jgi:hypothetical protein
MTVEEVKRNPLYRFTTRAIRNEFPFIKDFDVSQEDLDKYETIFLTLIIDAKEVIDTYGWQIYVWVFSDPQELRPFGGIFDVDFNEYKDKIRDKIEDIAWNMYFSDAVPEELKMGRRTISIAGYKVLPIDKSEVNSENIKFYSF